MKNKYSSKPTFASSAWNQIPGTQGERDLNMKKVEARREAIANNQPIPEWAN